MSIVTVVMGMTMVGASEAQDSSVYEIQAQTIDGQTVSLSNYRGKVALIVNVASRCGYTSQYQGLQKLYDTYKDRGLVVLGFPSNDFGGQEPGTESEIKAFCSNTYGVSFPMFSKVSVLGASKHPLYQALTAATGGSDVRWTFEKFLVDPTGKVVARFGSSTTPQDSALVSAIEKILVGAP
jgi:glutathione peroxidase